MTKTKKASTDLWKLDLLEANVYRTTPRLRRTKKLLASKKCPKIVSSITKSQSDIESYIFQLKEDVLAKKYHSAHTKLKRHINNQISNDLSKWKKSSTEKEVADFLNKPEVIDKIIKSRLVKCMINVFLIKKDGTLTAPSFISADTREAMVNKQHELHPSAIFKTYFQSNKELNNYFSNIWNTKTFKRLTEDIEWTFKQVRGGITMQEKNARKAVTSELNGSAAKGEDDLSSESDSDFDSEDDSDNDSGDEDDKKTKKSLKDIAASSRESQDDDSDSLEDQFAEYDNLVQGSDSEDNDEEPNQGRNDEINYNEVTDEESSDDVSEDENSPSTLDEEDDPADVKNENKKEKKEKKEKKKLQPYQLPELAVGYVSGDSDDDIADFDDDDVVREATTKRKNRRGQRARQKLWAKKFGKEAAHIKKKIENAQQEREKKQKEFEERERRRQLKRQRENDNESSLKVSDSITSRGPESSARVDINHPSWEAKKKAEEKIKNAKFQGKKIKFS